MKSTATVLCVSLAVLLASPASAQEKFNLGLSASVAAPMGDLKEWSGTGFGLAAFAEYGFADMMAGRLRAEYVKLGDKEITTKSELVTAKHKYGVNLSGIMADFVLGRLDGGPYGFAGLGYMGMAIKSEHYFNGASDGKLSGDNDGLAWSVGAGYCFNKHVGAEAKYTRLGNSDEGLNARDAN